MKCIKGRYIFGALTIVMILTIGLFFFLNVNFIQIQLEKNLVQEIEFYREIYSLKLNYLENIENDSDINQLFNEDSRSSKISILVYDAYGNNIAGNISKRNEGINNIKTMMLNGATDTLRYEGVFYSFTSVDTEYDNLYLMLEMSDQQYVEGVRKYYLRSIMIILVVSVSILLLGYKLIDMQKK